MVLDSRRPLMDIVLIQQFPFRGIASCPWSAWLNHRFSWPFLGISTRLIKLEPLTSSFLVDNTAYFLSRYRSRVSTSFKLCQALQRSPCSHASFFQFPAFKPFHPLNLGPCLLYQGIHNLSILAQTLASMTYHQLLWRRHLDLCWIDQLEHRLD